ncbi:MAG: cytochrome biosynthesis protein [Bacillales bacterium]|jgi:hypothetical protein|nr:cytochrome biosynthesis protein [Bacillales bacterium]
MFEIFTPIFDWISNPYWDLSQQFQSSTILYPLFLGLYCAFLQGQLIWNISAFVYFSKGAAEKLRALYLFLCFLLGKMVMYSIFVVVIWTSGRPPESVFLEYFPSIKFFYGIALIMVGFISFGVLKVPLVEKWTSKIPPYLNNDYSKTFILGSIFSFSFGDRTISIFFEDIMNIVLTSSIGSAVPSIFAIGTVLPILVMVLLLFILARSNEVVKQIEKGHPMAMRYVAVFMIVIGFYELFI